MNAAATTKNQMNRNYKTHAAPAIGLIILLSVIGLVLGQGGDPRKNTNSTATTPPKKTTPKKAPARRTTRPTNSNQTQTSESTEPEFWETIRNSSDVQDFKDYLQAFPNGAHAAIARTRIRQLEAAKANPAATPGAMPAATPAAIETTPANPTTTNTSLPNMPPNPPASLRSFEFVTATLDSSGNLRKRDRKSASAYTEDLGGGVRLEMVAIPPGEFMMGSPPNEAGRSDDESPQHRVRINYWFYLGKFEITQAQWRAVMGTNPSNFKECDECPVENVSWNDATEFCRKLGARTGREYRLPSEAEWEYAARAGTTTPFAFGDTITPEIVNYNGNYPYASAAKGTYREKTVPAGGLGIANGFGLYDMHGNVWEWCQDWYHASYSTIAGDAPTDGSAWLGGEQKGRVLRGGSWGSLASYLRSADRSGYSPGSRYVSLGFRVVAVARTQ